LSICYGKAWLEAPPSCGCTVTSLQTGTSERIGPGGSKDIEIEWEAKESRDRFAQSAVIGTTDPARPRLTLIVRGRFFAHVDASPQFFSMQGGDAGSATINIFSSDKADLEITGIALSQPDWFTATANPLTAEECKPLKAVAGYRIAVETKPGMPMGRYRQTMSIQTNHPDQPSLDIPIVGNVTAPISTMPPRLNVLAGTDRRQSTVSLVVHDDRPTRFEAVSPPDKLEFAIAPEQGAFSPANKQRYRLTLTIPAGVQAPQAITLKTDHPKAGVLTIPISVVSRREAPHVPSEDDME
jgi:hypothetical protein